MQTIAKRIELFFWDTTIPLLSESVMIRNSVKHSYQFYNKYKKDAWIILPIFASGALGLIVGCLLALYI